jgi:uncharacterized membrane protein
MLGCDKGGEMETSESDLETARHDTSSGVEPASASDRLVLTITREELAGLQSLVRLHSTRAGTGDELEQMAGLVMLQGLMAKLKQAGLSSDIGGGVDDGDKLQVAERANEAPDVVLSPRGRELSTSERTLAGSSNDDRPRSALASLWGNARTRKRFLLVLAATTAIVLFGGYAGGWGWTGLQSNGQVWDWLKLLLLPVAVATVPIWLSYGERMSRHRKLAFVAAIVAFIAFVVAGYLVPISWTGFSGNNLWDWLTLLVLPLAVVSIGAWPSSSRQIRGTHIAVLSALGVAWLVTVVGGYAASWQWTGYPGNTLWDWIQLLLAPLVITTVLVPSAVRWLSGDVARIVAAERERLARAEMSVAGAARKTPPGRT